MKNKEEINYLIKELISKNNRVNKNIEIPEDYLEKRQLLRALMNTQTPVELSEKFYQIQDKILQEETKNKDLASVEDTISFCNDKNKIESKLALWQGDITCLKVDGIVNAGNSELLGCFIPLHNCIDNQIHSAAGFQLRMDCYKIMEEQGHSESVGTAKITKAYNLPSKYVLHTVGPALPYGKKPSKKECEELSNCYKSCLKLAELKGLKTIAFCSISTGVFNFPKEKATEIAIETSLKYIKENPNTNIEKIIFNTFSDDATELYKNYLMNL